MKKTLALAAVAAAIVPATSIAVAQGAPSDAQARDATAPSPTLTVRTTRFEVDPGVVEIGWRSSASSVPWGTLGVLTPSS
jgi:hypothetical protein